MTEQGKRGFQPYNRNHDARNSSNATQGFTQGMQRIQEVANDMAGICHVI